MTDGGSCDRIVAVSSAGQLRFAGIWVLASMLSAQDPANLPGSWTAHGIGGGGAFFAPAICSRQDPPMLGGTLMPSTKLAVWPLKLDRTGGGDGAVATAAGGADRRGAVRAGVAAGCGGAVRGRGEQ